MSDTPEGSLACCPSEHLEMWGALGAASLSLAPGKSRSEVYYDNAPGGSVLSELFFLGQNDEFWIYVLVLVIASGVKPRMSCTQQLKKKQGVWRDTPPVPPGKLKHLVAFIHF